MHIVNILHILHIFIPIGMISSWQSQACWTPTIRIKKNVPSPPSASPLRDLSGANSPGPDAPQPVPPPVPVPPSVQPVPVPPLAAQAQQHRPVDMIGNRIWDHASLQWPWNVNYCKRTRCKNARHSQTGAQRASRRRDKERVIKEKGQRHLTICQQNICVLHQ